MRLAPTRCTLYTAAADTADAYGDATLTQTAHTTTCYIEQTQTREAPTLDGSLSSTTWSIHLPPDVQPDGNSQVVIGSDTYTLLGDPWSVINGRTGELSHYECSARRVD